MTSNLGSQQIRDLQEEDHDIMRAAVMDEVRKHFKPEFINRIDDIVVFQMLMKDQIDQVLTLQLKSLEARMKSQGMSFQLTERARQAIIEAGYDPTYGARPLKRTIARLVENALAQQILKGELNQGQTIMLDWHNGKMVVS